MKKIIFLLCLLALARANTFGQCGNCTSVIPLADNDFSQFHGTNNPVTFSCSLGPISSYSTAYFNHVDLPNWFRLDGSPQITNGNQMYLCSNWGYSVGRGDECSDYGYQSVFANYPFLARGIYNVSVNYYGNNSCSTVGNTKIGMNATSGLSEPAGAPANFVDNALTTGSSPFSLGTYSPPALLGGPGLYQFDAFSLCTSSLPENKSQLEIYVSQNSAATYTINNDVSPAGLEIEIASVNIQLCNQCPQNIYNVTSSSSIDPTSHAPFSLGGLFVDAAILIDGPYTGNVRFTNNPGLNELLWAKYIEIDRSATTGNAFLAAVNGTFFEMLPNNSCGNVCSLDPIQGPSSLCVGDVYYTFTNSTGGGTWSSSNPAIVAIDPHTGYVGGVAPGSPTGTVTITYTVNGCSVTKTVSRVNCSPQGGRMMQLNDSTGTNNMVNVYPNPAHNNITISYASQSSQLLRISIKDVNGGIVHTESVMCNGGDANEHSVDISTFAPGFYFVELTLGDQHVVKKIIKQ